MDLHAQVESALAQVQSVAGAGAPQVGMVLGSGLGAFAKQLSAAVVLPYGEIPYHPRSQVAGHAGQLVVGMLKDVRCVLLCGRAHYYEGHSPAESTFGIRLLCRWGVPTLLLTNAAGGINPAFAPGDCMLISDHLNMTGVSALRGPQDPRLGPRFPDMSEAYSPRLRQLAYSQAQGLALREGIYAGVAGPNYETPAEVRMLGRLGADAVGMSTVHETTVARQAGAEVLGLSVITNLAAGLKAQVLTHAEVTATAARVEGEVGRLLSNLAQAVVA